MSFTGQFIQGVIKDILSGLEYLDENDIMHRDIKPENVILREEDGKWVISDFGLAAKSNEEYLYDKCGTMGYIAPEIMELQENQKYAQSCDTYSLGVVAYQLIVG
jgi:serine/threonine protein kinase